MSTKPPIEYKSAGILVPLGIYSLLGISFLIAFSALRVFFPLTYAPRARLKKVAPPNVPRGCLSWLVPIFTVTETELIHNVGLDGVMLLRFLKMCCDLFAVLSVIGALVLIPLNVTANGNLPEKISEEQWMTLMSIENVPNQSYSILSTHIIFSWIYTFIVYYFIIRFYNTFVKLRYQQQEAILQRSKLSKIEMRSVMVFGIPSDLRHEVDLATFFEGLGLGIVENVVICRRWVRLREAVSKRAYYLKQLESLYARVKSRRGYWWRYWWSRLVGLHKTDEASRLNHSVSSLPLPSGRLAPSDSNEACIFEIKTQLDAVPKHLRPRHRTHFLGMSGPIVDSADFYASKFVEWDREVTRLRRVSKESNATAVAFVTFALPITATLVSQILMSKRAFAYMTRMAPEPRDVFWPNLSSAVANPMVKFMRGLGVQAALIFLVFFTATPIALLAGWTTPAGLAKLIPPLKDVFGNMSPFVRSLLTGALPALVTSLWLALLPSLLFYLSQAQGLEALSWIEQSVLSKYHFYQVTNVVVIFTIARSVWSAISIFDVIQQPGLLLNILADSMPRMASFYVNYVIFQTFAVFPAQLLLLGPLFWTWAGRLAPWTRQSPRDVSDAYYPSVLTSINYGVAYPMPLLILAVGLTYSQILPIILPFATLCFGIAWIVYKYQLLYVHIPKFETLGGFVPLVVNRTMLGVAIYQVVMMAVLALKMVPRDKDVAGIFIEIQGGAWSPYAYTVLSMLPLLALTGFVYWWMKRGYFKQTRNVPMEILGSLGMELGAENHLGHRDIQMQTQSSPLGAEELVTHHISPHHLSARSDSSMGKELKDITSPIIDSTSTEFLGNPWATPRQLEKSMKNGAENMEHGSCSVGSADNLKTRRRPRRASRVADIQGIRKSWNPRASPSADEQQSLLGGDGSSDSEDEWSTTVNEGYHAPSWPDTSSLKSPSRSRQESSASYTTGGYSDLEPGFVPPHPPPPAQDDDGDDDAFHVEPPMTRVNGILDPPLDAAHWPFLAAGDEQDLILANGGAYTNGSSHQSQHSASGASLSRGYDDDLSLHSYLHPVLIGRLPLPWLPGAQSRVVTEARIDQGKFQKNEWNRISRQLRIGVRLDLARPSSNDSEAHPRVSDGAGNEEEHSEGRRIRRREVASTTVSTRVKSFIDGATSWLYLALTE
ncbi:hypothetical protein SeMB42_g02206 [Synchytrium endobioticum]|uniref:CSC1/OSCA1-like 7TM region domain-containing protein n=1 Tax=Synchytrium endobioticum TaxID=286115 RepID=A0A507DIB2_9FUNG|nr:hypothetical protein SeLEV6574_g01121 [Synchytrium endobioticum]TPX50580.1 hypothetical protein SeMB42_g02206 [Synchytrium endobioticum]